MTADLTRAMTPVCLLEDIEVEGGVAALVDGEGRVRRPQDFGASRRDEGRQVRVEHDVRPAAELARGRRERGAPRERLCFRKPRRSERRFDTTEVAPD